MIKYTKNSNIFDIFLIKADVNPEIVEFQQKKCEMEKWKIGIKNFILSTIINKISIQECS